MTQEDTCTGDVPVAIIGGGVVGLSMALALERHGVDAVVLERSDGPNRHPRAHVANPRTLELFRLWGIEEQVRAAGLAPEATGNFVWLSAISGAKLGEVRYAHREGGLALRERLTLTPEVSCAQDVIEGILRGRLREVTGRDVRFGANVIDTVAQPDGGVTLSIEGDPRPLRAAYVVAADGAGSPTRKRLGIGMEGPDELARFVSIYLHADLSRWTERRPAVLYWVVNPRVQGVFIAMDGRSRYVFHLRIDPARESIEDFPPDRCRDLLYEAIGRRDVDIDVVAVGHWLMSGQVAERYRDGDVFLVGDSAHRFPPTGGFGMNTGIQDAHNLAWKLAAAMSGWAPAALLDSYEPERRPVAEVNRSRSVVNFLQLERLAMWSLDPGPILERLDDAGPDGDAERERFRDEIERQREHFDKLEQELGFVYERGALVPDGDGVPDGDTAGLSRAAAGTRVPLMRLMRRDGTEVATTDLFECEFVLIAHGPGGWEEAATALVGTDVPLRYEEIGRDLLDVDGGWASASGTAPGGALLVRPDGHVGFRAPGPTDDPAVALADAMTVILRGGATASAVATP